MADDKIHSDWQGQHPPMPNIPMPLSDNGRFDVASNRFVDGMFEHTHRALNEDEDDAPPLHPESKFRTKAVFEDAIPRVEKLVSIAKDIGVDADEEMVDAFAASGAPMDPPPRRRREREAIADIIAAMGVQSTKSTLLTIAGMLTAYGFKDTSASSMNALEPFDPQIDTGVQRDGAGLPIFDAEGRPKFARSQVYVANPDPHTRLVVVPTTRDARRARAEDVLKLKEVDLDESFVVVVGNDVASPLMRKLAAAISRKGIRAADAKYFVTVRYDAGPEAGASGDDTFAPHVWFEFDYNTLLDKRKGEGEGRDDAADDDASRQRTGAVLGDPLIAGRTLDAVDSGGLPSPPASAPRWARTLEAIHLNKRIDRDDILAFRTDYTVIEPTDADAAVPTCWEYHDRHSELVKAITMSDSDTTPLGFQGLDETNDGLKVGWHTIAYATHVHPNHIPISRNVESHAGALASTRTGTFPST